MPDYFRKVSAGEPFRPAAPTWNAMLDAALANMNRQRRGGSPGASHELSPAVVDVYNDTGSAVPPFAVLAVDGILIPPATDIQQFVNRPCLKVKTPTVDNASAKLVVTNNWIGAGAIGKAVIMGASVAKVNMQSATDKVAGPTAGDFTKLTSGSGPVQILYAEAGTGDKWAMVLLGGGSSNLPAPTARYQVLQCDTFNTLTGAYTLLFDWVRAH